MKNLAKMIFQAYIVENDKTRRTQEAPEAGPRLPAGGAGALVNLRRPSS
jgi:hypothetical protein